MADVIQVEKGCDPWRPSHDSVLVKQYRYYDMPLEGIIEQHGVRYYFQCMSGAQDQLNSWAYSYVGPDEESELDAATAEEFAQREARGPMALAFALEGLGVVCSTVIDEVTDDSIRAAHRQLAEEFRELAEAASHLTPA